MIEIKDLTKIYGDHIAVDNISFTLKPGNIYGFLGPNGAGKSTTLNIITGNLAATYGNVLINGHDVAEQPTKAKKYIGYLPENPPLYLDMTPFEYLSFVAEAKGIDYDVALRQIAELMQKAKLMPVKNRLIKNLSKGYCQRIGIAEAFLGDPEIIILDEPIVGLDPKQIIEIRELIKDAGKDKIVIFSSHLLSEVSTICDHIIMINRGKIVANNSIRRLESLYAADGILSLTVKGNPDEISKTLSSIKGVKDVKRVFYGSGAASFELTTDKSVDVRDSVFLAMAEKKHIILNMSLSNMSLESIYLSLVDSYQDIDEEVKK